MLRKIALIVILIFLALLVMGMKGKEPSTPYDHLITNVHPRLHAERNAGIHAGLVPTRFCKVGDSNSQRRFSFHMIDNDEVRVLGDYEALMPTVEHFRGSFWRDSIATMSGYTTRQLIDPSLLSQCSGMSRVQCEVAAWQCLYAIVQIGTNDVIEPTASVEQYRTDLGILVNQLQELKVIPMLVTLPRRCGDTRGRPVPGCYPLVEEYNIVIRQMAEDLKLPLLDLREAVDPLPNNGLQRDLIHFSSNNILLDTAIFTDPYLVYGYNTANLIRLILLDEIRTVLE